MTPSDEFQRRHATYLNLMRNLRWLGPKKRKRPPRKGGGEPEREPVEPDKPRPLQGGAAAELQFDD